jgi:predicted RNA-binding Zn-ribbon protein involved in translation (DUF1610 family)
MEKSQIAVCDECGSSFIRESSEMSSLCPECAHVLYGYANCGHIFKGGRCTKCYWDGSETDYIKKLKLENEGQDELF